MFYKKILFQFSTFYFILIVGEMYKTFLSEKCFYTNVFLCSCAALYVCGKSFLQDYLINRHFRSYFSFLFSFCSNVKVFFLLINTDNFFKN